MVCPRAWCTNSQRVQNCAARIVTRRSRSDHISPVLKDLHWLPVHRRVQFKFCCTHIEASTSRHLVICLVWSVFKHPQGHCGLWAPFASRSPAPWLNTVKDALSTRRQLFKTY
jgi:hypothetical protein